MFLCENLCKKYRVEIVKQMIGFEGVFTVEAQGHIGGLILFWRNKDDITLRSYNKNHIE